MKIDKRSFPYTLIDLTHELDALIPTWTNNPGFECTTIFDYSDCSGEFLFRVQKLSCAAGIGTHIDAPAHCIPEGKTVEQLTIENFLRPCIVIDCSQKADEIFSLQSEDILAFEEQHGPIPTGSIVIVYTGWSKHWHNRERYHNNHRFPSVGLDAAQLLLERTITALGIDTLSADRPDNGFVVHKLLLGARKYLIENIANAHLLPPTGSFALVAPLKVKSGTESPIRLFGLITN